jgi:hypothetical protein
VFHEKAKFLFGFDGNPANGQMALRYLGLAVSLKLYKSNE